MADSVFVATNGGLAVLERANGGFDRAADRFEGQPVTAVVSDPAEGLVYVGTHAGVHRSGDGGRTWRPLSDDLEPKAVAYLHVDPATHRLYVGAHPIELFYTDDRGASWTQVGFVDKIPERYRKTWMFHPLPHLGPHVKSISTSQGRIFVNIEEGWGYRSDDDGATWTQLRNGLHIDAHVLAAHPANADEVYTTHAFGASKSLDGGTTWQSIDVSEYGIKDYGGGIAVHPRDPDVVLFSLGVQRVLAQWIRGAGSRIYRTQDGGQSWERVSRGLPEPVLGRIETLAFDRAPEPALYATSDVGDVFESRDAGSSWRTIATGLNATYLCGLATL